MFVVVRSPAFRLSADPSVAANWRSPLKIDDRKRIKSLRRFLRFGFISAADDGKRSIAGLMERQRLHVFYSGTVQGVGFRYTVKALARGFEVTGTVRNLPDGRVELLAEGARAELEAFRRTIADSELGHFIRKEEPGWSEAKNEFRGFEIAH